METKRFLKIHEVANLLCVSPSTLRNYEKRGNLVANRNKLNNYRVYDYEIVKKFAKEKLGIEIDKKNNGYI